MIHARKFKFIFHSYVKICQNIINTTFIKNAKFMHYWAECDDLKIPKNTL